MRFTNLLVVASVAGVASTTAHAQQDSRASTEARVRVATPAPAGVYRYHSTYEAEHRAAIGIGTQYSGTLRDTLGILITSITKGSPAEKAGLEEGNRIAAINDVSLRVSAADVEDNDMSSAIARRLTRELSKSKPGDDVELKVYREGRFQTTKLKTADSDVLFARTASARTSREDMDNRPMLGFSTGSTGSRRDTLGVLVMSVADSTPAAKAGIEEGNRIAAINGVNLRVAKEDAGDRSLSSIKAQRLQREISQLKPGDNVTLKVYSNGQFRDVALKVGRAGDLPRNQRGMMYFGGEGFSGGRAMPVMPAMPRMAPMPPMEGYRFELSPEFQQNMDDVRMHLEGIRPQLERIGPEVQFQLDRLRPQLERIGPEVQWQLDRIRPQLERLRMDLPRVMQQVRIAPRVRMVTVL